MPLEGIRLEASTDTLFNPPPGATIQVQTEIRVKGKSVHVPSAEVDGRTVTARGRWLKVAAVKDEELVEGDTVADPDTFIQQLKNSGLQADLFTFAQRLPSTTPKYDYPIEWDNVAAIEIATYSHWWKNCVEYSIRKAVNRSKKLGVVVKLVALDDEMVKGIRHIYGESPVRQGRRFWHHKKDHGSLKRELETYLDRSTFIGAYYQDELIGSMKLTYVNSAATIMQIFCAKSHFDKRPNNALIAKAVELCESQGKSHLIYGSFIYNDSDSTLTEFKRRNGFSAVLLPRYYIPLTIKGRIALLFRLHHNMARKLPQPVLRQLLRFRSLWYIRRLKVEGSST